MKSPAEQIDVGHPVLFVGRDASDQPIKRPAVVTRHLGMGVCDLAVTTHPDDGLKCPLHKAAVGYDAGGADRTWQCVSPHPVQKDDETADDNTDDDQASPMIT